MQLWWACISLPTGISSHQIHDENSSETHQNKFLKMFGKMCFCVWCILRIKCGTSHFTIWQTLLSVYISCNLDVCWNWNLWAIAVWSSHYLKYYVILIQHVSQRWDSAVTCFPLICNGYCWEFCNTNVSGFVYQNSVQSVASIVWQVVKWGLGTFMITVMHLYLFGGYITFIGDWKQQRNTWNLGLIVIVQIQVIYARISRYSL